MKYRKFAAADTDVSLLGFGAMRLPVIDGDAGKINEAEATRMLRHAINGGVNYIDTAYVYHMRQCEAFLGRALADGYREKVLLATKMPYWVIDSPDEMLSLFDEQLEKLKTDYIDMYLIHDIRGETWDQIQEWKIWDFLVKQREAGRIRFIGFSFHGESPAEFKMVLDAHQWDFCQLQINFMDKDIQAGLEGYDYAVSKGVPIVVMEPLKGGRFTSIIKPSIRACWDSLGSGRTPAEWALRWVANLPGVITILSGMNTMEQVEENIRVLSDADVGMLSEPELAKIDAVAEEYRKLTAYPCTACKYCLPCTADIDIPDIIERRNSVDLYGMTKGTKFEYDMYVPVKASACTECGKCEPECPQHLKIIEIMKETTEIFKQA